MALTNLEAVRVELSDNEPGLYLISDDEIEYFLTKNDDNVARATIDCAKTILLKLAMRGNEQVDIFSFSGAKSAEQYRLSLQLFLKDPNLNPILKNVKGYIGGVSISDMQANNDNPDNNALFRGRYPRQQQLDSFSTNRLTL